MTTHRSSHPFRTRSRRLAAVLGAFTVISLATAGLAVADSASVDGNDGVKAPDHVQYSGTVGNSANYACSERGTLVDGTILISFNNAGGNTNHLTAGRALSVGLSVAGNPAGITVAVASDAVLTVPTPWESGSTHSIGIETTVATSVPVGTYTVTATVSDGIKTLTDTYNVAIDVSCPITSSNVAPSVAVTSAPASVDEGSGAVVAFSITDPDSSSWTFATGYPDCGGGSASAASIDNATKTGTFTCTYVDGVVPPQDATVGVKVTDGDGAASNVATADITVENVAPGVAAPAFTAASVDCRNEATLGGISFTDPGVQDGDWAVSIDWGDGSTATQFDAADQGAQSNRTHTYDAPGTYTATVTVTDKDGELGSASTATGITVNQTYAVDFLPPFDDSSPSKLIVNKMKNGRVVPVKVSLYDECAQAPVTDPAQSVTIKTTKTAGGGTSDPIEEYADAGQSASNTNRFRLTDDGFWIYNLDSKALGLVVNNNYRVDVYVGAVKATVDSWAVLQPVK